MKNISFLLFLTFTFLSCINSQKKKFVLPKKFSSVEHKICEKDSSQSYELYIPKNHPDKIPVIFIFDPHAHGKTAIINFLEASELYGYMLVASNNSKNGVEKLDYILKTLLDEIENKYTTDPMQKYAAGFSGGGRVASILAQSDPGIQGVISSGAGFSPSNSPRAFQIVLIAGNEDFNYDETTYSLQQLKLAGWQTLGFIFDGGHQWPPKELINKSVLWFQINAMRKNIIPKDQGLIEMIADSFRTTVDKLVAENHYFDAANECNTALSFLENIGTTKYFKNKLEEIQTSNEYLIENQNLSEISYLEQQLRNGYLDAFNSQPLHWWQNEIQVLNQSIPSEKNKTKKQMLQRLKGFLGIVCYSYSNRAANQNDLKSLEKFISIYELIEPQNADCFFFKSVLFKKMNKIAASDVAYAKALELGFSDLQKAKQLLGK